MAIPDEVQSAIEELIEKIPPSKLRQAREKLSKTYSSTGSSHQLFQEEVLRLTYLASRMPATYAAVESVFLQLLETSESWEPKRWLDIGAGPGTASWVAATLFPKSSEFRLVEKNKETIALGKKLCRNHPALMKAHWEWEISPKAVHSADAAVFSYSLGEMKDPSDWISAWHESDIPYLVVIEPGTPRGFALIRKIREQILQHGRFLIAPCPHAFSCPMQGSDWCHFSVRLPRNRLQRYLKGGSLGYEDEKYSYLVASKHRLSLEPVNFKNRILRRPEKHSGHVRLTLCTEEGSCEKISITRSDAEQYRRARKAEWGDLW